MEGDSYVPGVLTGLLILVDWDEIEPVCSIPCYSTTSDEIDFSYFVGTEQWVCYGYINRQPCNVFWK